MDTRNAHKRRQLDLFIPPGALALAMPLFTMLTFHVAMVRTEKDYGLVVKQICLAQPLHDLESRKYRVSELAALRALEWGIALPICILFLHIVIPIFSGLSWGPPIVVRKGVRYRSLVYHEEEEKWLLVLFPSLYEAFHFVQILKVVLADIKFLQVVVEITVGIVPQCRSSNTTCHVTILLQHTQGIRWHAVFVNQIGKGIFL